MKKQFIVTVDATASIDTGNNSIAANIKNVDDSYALEAIYETAKTEYTNTFNRITKLDQKVSFTLAVYAFMATILCDGIKIKDSSSWVSGVYYSLIAVAIIIFMYGLIRLLSLLKSDTMKRYDIKDILQDRIYEKKSVEAVESICVDYEYYMRYNDEILDEKYKVFKKCINISIVTFVFIFVIKIFNVCLK